MHVFAVIIGEANACLPQARGDVGITHFAPCLGPPEAVVSAASIVRPALRVLLFRLRAQHQLANARTHLSGSPFGCGSNTPGGFGPCFHLPIGFHFGTGFLSHSHLASRETNASLPKPRKPAGAIFLDQIDWNWPMSFLHELW